MKYKHIVLSGLVLFFAAHGTTYAQGASLSALEDISPSPITYQLPYPGLLPDNPLYFLKVFRDDVSAFFISKPLEKADFSLLQSDKNLEASYLLVTQEKTVFALQTISKAQDDFQEALTEAAEAKKQGYSTSDITKRLQEANQKHEEILGDIGQMVSQKDMQRINSELARCVTFAKTIKALRS